MNSELITLLLPVAFTHLVAFLIFIWLLKIFAVGPILRLLDERRQRIATQFDDLQKAEKRVASLKDEYAEHLQKIDEEARKRMLEEVSRGRRIAEEIALKARTDSVEIIEKARSNVQIQLEQARLELKEEIIAMVIEATERLIQERLDEAKHRELVGAFVDEIQKRKL
ncbi:F0F1 ATP synthase subunit B [Candidatus Sumerlaeota bacterium]|nr:F0F1 ATP synthase subunit B [Candidatus Sumerlaeota bacterium]